MLQPEPLTMSFGFIAGMISMAVGFGVFVVPATFYHALRMQ